MEGAKNENMTSKDYNLKSVDSWATTTMEEETFAFRWNIRNFRKIFHTLPCGGELNSPEFIGGNTTRHTWFLRIKKNRGTDDCIGLFLNLKKVGKPNESNKLYTGFQVSILGRNDESLFQKDDSDCPDDFLGSSSWGYSKFLNNDDLLDTTKGYIVDDQLTIHCRLWVSKEMKSYEVGEEEANATKVEKKICEALKELFETSKCHDFTISTGTQEFKAHKCILAARSSVFDAMFNTEMSEAINGKITISDFPDSIIKSMLSYMYSGEVENLKDDAMELLRIADKYDIKDLKEDCIRIIPSTLSIENAVEILFAVDKYNIPKLKSKVIEYIILNREAMDKTTLFPDLVKELFTAMCAVHSL